jgi:hypothetical protein
MKQTPAASAKAQTHEAQDEKIQSAVAEEKRSGNGTHEGIKTNQIVALTGTVPVITVSPLLLQFFFPNWGPHSVTVTNIGTGPAVIKSFSLDELLPRLHGPTPFAVSNGTCPTSPQPLPAGGSCTITITYSRPKPAAYNAALVLLSETAVPYALVDLWGN